MRFCAVLWMLLLHVGLYAALVPQLNSAGMHWGCRFLLVAYPLLGALAAVTFAATWRRSPARRSGFGATRSSPEVVSGS